MNDPEELQKNGHAGYPQGRRSPDADIRQISNIIIALNLIKTHLVMYPPGHMRISESVSHAFTLIQKALRNRSEITIEIAEGTLMVGTIALDRKNAPLLDYASSLSNHHIVSFSLLAGLKKEELIEFNRIISSKPSEIWALGKMDAVLIRFGITGIKAKAIDTDDFNLKQERVVQPDDKKMPAKIDFWKAFVADLTSRASKAGVAGTPENEPPTSPSDVIRILNKQQKHWQSVIASYEIMVQDYFYGIRKGKPVPAEKYEALCKVSGIIKDLHPDLKEQLLEVVERQFSLQSEELPSMEDLKCFPQEMMQDMIHLSSEKNGQISPTLMMLLQKMNNPEEKGLPEQTPDKDDLSSKQIENLLKREEHEKYVPEDYDDLLKKSLDAASLHEDDHEEKFPIEDYFETLTDEYCDLRICLLLLPLMDQETIEEENYLVYGTRLAQYFPKLFKSGSFLFLIDLMETLHRHGQEKSTDEMRKKAVSLLKPFSDHETMARYITPLILEGTTDIPSMSRFLVISGAQNLSWLFDLYLDPSTRESYTLMEILKGFGDKAVEEAVNKLSDPEPQRIVRLLVFIREAGNRTISSSLRELYKHKDLNVKREVLETLLHFDDSAVVDILKGGLKSSRRDEVFLAVSFACRRRLGNLLDDLISMLKTCYIREEDAILNQWIIQELAATGDPAALPHLERISRIRLSLSPKHLSQMKVIFYHSLSHFPRESIKPILKRGKRSMNREIRETCARIMGAAAEK